MTKQREQQLLDQIAQMQKTINDLAAALAASTWRYPLQIQPATPLWWWNSPQGPFRTPTTCTVDADLAS